MIDLLKILKITNFAIIKYSEFELYNGLSVFSGETGAGKSIILKAIKFVLGARADKTNIRSGEDFAKVQAVFFNVGHQTLSVLSEYNIEYDDCLIINRIMYQDGRNSIQINGENVTLTMLVKVCQSMVDIYNQEDHFSLLDKTKQLSVIDCFAGDKLKNLKKSLNEKLEDYNSICNRLLADDKNEEEKQRELDFLKFQIDEIQSNIFTEDEESQLESKKKIFNNAKKISDSLNECEKIFNFCYNGNGVDSALKDIQTELHYLTQFDENFELLNKRIGDVKIELDDILETISSKIDNVEITDNDIDLIENRLEKIKEIQKKYGKTRDIIDKVLQEKQQRVLFLENGEEEINKLNKQKTELELSLNSICNEITNERKHIAKNFESKIIKVLSDLGMNNTKFVVNFSKTSTFCFDCGLDNVEFLFSANLGQDVKPLNKIISGGELSRFMLAYKVVLSEHDKVDLLIFDEIDAGVSGEAGVMIAEKLCDISKFSQVLCISHLPQIVSYADYNYKIQKFVNDNQTISEIKLMTTKEKQDEIIRLIGLGCSSENSINLANEIIEQSKNYKK